MEELEAKIRLFEAIANNSEYLCGGGRYKVSPYTVATYVNEIYDKLKDKQ